MRIKKLILLILLSVLVSLNFCKRNQHKIIKVGFLYPFNTKVGESMKNSAILTVDKINKSGGIVISKNGIKNTYKIKLVFIDDGYTEVARGSYNFRKAIEKHNLKYVIGGLLSKVILPLMEIMAEKKVLWLCVGGASNRIITKIEKNYEKYKYYFRTGVLDTLVQGKAVAEFAKKTFLPRGIKKIVALGLNHSYGKQVLNRITSLLKIAGFKIIYKRFISSDIKDFSTILKKIQNAHAIACVFLSKEAETLITLAGKLGINKRKPIFGVIAPSYAPDFFEKTKKGAAWTSSYQSNGGPVDKTGKKLVFNFIKKYVKRFKKPPFWLSYGTYDAFRLFKKSVENTKSFIVDDIIKTIENDNFEYEGLRLLKWNKKNHDLIFGLKNGKFYAHGTIFQYFPDGKRYPVYPDKYKVRNYAFPLNLK